jgi:nitroreductase
MRACIDLALAAPNSSNLQPWEFHWVRSDGLKAEVAKACFGQPAASTAAELVVCVARTATWNEHRKIVLEQLRAQPGTPKSALDYYTKLVPFVYTTGPLDVLGPLKWAMTRTASLVKPLPHVPLSRKDLELWATKSTALACENLMLAIRAHGFDSCPMEGFAEAPIKRALKLSRDARIVMVVGAGRRAEGGIYGPQHRVPRERVAFEH